MCYISGQVDMSTRQPVYITYNRIDESRVLLY
jgi:hypothetical protein